MDDVAQAVGAVGGAKAMAGYSGAKLSGFAGVGALMGVAVVMAMTAPPSRKELFVCVISSVAFSMGLGGSVIMYFDLQHWADSYFGLMAILGIAFTCSLPGWILVRSIFIFAEKNKGKDIGQIVHMIKGWFK